MEDNELNSEQNNLIESSEEIQENKKIKIDNNESESDSLIDKTDSETIVNKKTIESSDDLKTKAVSIFKRFLDNGFDGITTNPNYKMLALLIILLVNLSLFFILGSLGKSFLRNSGLMS